MPMMNTRTSTRRSSHVISVAENTFGNHLIYEPILENSGSAEIGNLAKTCKLFRSVVLEYMKNTFSINRKLGHFFDDPSEFRAMQAWTGSILSGSFALGFFARCHLPDSGIDIFVTTDAYKHVGNWLVENGYIYTPAQPTVDDGVRARTLQLQDYDWDREAERGWSRSELDGLSSFIQGLENIYKFERVQQGSVRRVKMFVGSGNPVLQVLHFHSSQSVLRPITCGHYLWLGIVQLA